MLSSASDLASRREESVQKAFSVDHHGPGDARLSHRATAIYGEYSDYVQAQGVLQLLDMHPMRAGTRPLCRRHVCREVLGVNGRDLAAGVVGVQEEEGRVRLIVIVPKRTPRSASCAWIPASSQVTLARGRSTPIRSGAAATSAGAPTPVAAVERQMTNGGGG